MDFRLQTLARGAYSAATTDALILVLAGDAASLVLDDALKAVVQDAVGKGDFEIKAGRSLYIHRPAGVKAPRLVLVGAKDASAKSFKAAVAAGVNAIKALGVKAATVAVGFEGELTDDHAEAFATAAEPALYVYRHTKPSAPKASSLVKLTLAVAKSETKATQAGLARGQAISAGVALARELGNKPANVMTPTQLGEEAKQLGKDFGLKVEVMDKKAIEKLGMGSFLSVAQGSDEAPRFIVVKYEGAAKSQAPVVLVGKGIMFDSGGISLKPGPAMDEMKWDMCGAASVLGTLRAVAELKAKVNLIGVIPSCENMPSGRALKPGDVVTSMSGQTIEILNTDAEGRLILCDALTYVERFKPKAVVDIATLTGACVIALGHHHSGLYANDDELGASLQSAGVKAQDTAWRMPLDEEYDDTLKSNFADMANVGSRSGGSITAARFLAKFTGAYKWAHLDIAGTSHHSAGAAKGATGRPVALLTHFVLSQA